MGKQSLRAFVVLMLVLGSLLAIGGIAMAQDESLSIYDNLVKAGNFTTLTSAIDEKGLTETYTGDGNEYTFFAPNDAAFQALSLSDRIKLYRNPQTLIDTLNHMTVEGVYNTADLTDGTVLTALDGGTLTITHEGSKILVNGAEITSPDLAASNGVIHVVSSVIPLEGAAPVVEEEVAAEDEEVAATETTTATVEASAVVTATEASTETVAGAAIEAVTERVTAEATEAPAEEATAVPAEEATAEPAEEATAVPAEEATAEPAEEATAAPAEEAAAAPAEEATAVPAEEAAAESAEEATAEPAEEATAEPAEEAAATPEPTEEAPEELPATGAESNSLALVAVAVLTIMLLGAFTFVSRRNA